MVLTLQEQLVHVDIKPEDDAPESYVTAQYQDRINKLGSLLKEKDAQISQNKIDILKLKQELETEKALTLDLNKKITAHH